MKKVISVAGTRPNFIKIAPLYKAFRKYEQTITHKICHTGQHFDKNLSDVFFSELEIPKPDFYLGVGSGTHAEQTARIMVEFEKVLLAEHPDMIIVPGDVNSTMACSLVASKLGIPIAHVESGLRSFDRSMPEEINRLVTDALSELLFVSEESGLKNLSHEGIPDNKVFFTGNIMIDSLVWYLPGIDGSDIHERMQLEPGKYILTTFHRPSNVDEEGGLSQVVSFLNRCSRTARVVFPVHPRTRKTLEQYNLAGYFEPGVLLTDPIGYIDFLALTRKAALVITDSGGIQEETTFLSIPCITVRNNTERPVTVTEGTNYLAGTDLDKLDPLVKQIMDGRSKKGSIPQFWDGRTAERITSIISDRLSE